MEKKVLSRSGNRNDEIPDAKYTLFGERIRQAIPGPMQCSVGCGGKNCKWENPSRWSDAEQAIKGVFSSWVLDNVVAMSRPSTEIMKKYKMIDQFKRHNIRSIINLQRPGEHASCGPPLNKESLFTYRPQDFMDNDIFFYNFGWKDYGVASMTTILDMVKVMSFALEEGKVAVHCHAGLGRTGVLIACYLIYAERMDPATAIISVRKKRPNSIQTRGQIACISEFWQFLRPLRIVFPQVVPNARRLTLKQFLNRQRLLLHGFESRELRHVPKLVHVVCKRLSEIAQSRDGVEVVDGSPRNILKRSNTFSEIKENLPGAFVNETEEEATSSVLEISNYRSSPTEALLPSRAPQPGSERSISFSSDVDTPLFEATPSQSSAKIVLGSESEEEKQPTSNERKASLEAETMTTDPNGAPSIKSDSIQDSSRSKDFNSNINELQKVTDIPDELIEREVNEILGNANNNHSIKNPSPAVHAASGNLASDLPSVPHNLVKKDLTSPDESRQFSESSSTSVDARFDSEPNRLPSQQTAVLHRKLMPSGGKSDTVLPTGSPIKNPRSSAKGKQPSVVTADGVNVKIDTFCYSDSESFNSKDLPGTLLALPRPPAIPSPITNNSPTSNDSDPASVSSPSTPTNAQPVRPEPMLMTPDVGVISACSLTAPVDSSNDDDDITRTDVTITPGDISIVEATPNANSLNSLDRSCSPFDATSDADATEASSPELVPNASVPSKQDDCDAQATEDAVGASMSSFSEENATFDLNESLPRKGEAGVVAEDVKSNDVKLKDTSNYVSDDNLDEIIDIVIDDGNDGQSLNRDVEIQPGNSSQSMASRVSWSLMQGGSTPLQGDKKQLSDASDTSRQSGRKTPLMYRGEKNLKLIVEDNVVTEDGLSLSKEVGRSRSDFSDDDVFAAAPSNIVDLNVGSSSSDDANVNEPERLDCQQNKEPTLLRINATRSLNDLSFHCGENPVPLSRCSSSGDMRHPSPQGHQSSPEQVIPINVALALSYKLVDDEWLWEKVYSLQFEINNHKDAWKTVSKATDPYLLSALMWTWIEHLSQPVLRSQNVSQLTAIISRASDSRANQMIDVFEKALNSLEPSICNTLKCLLICVTSFPPLPKRIADSMVERVVCAVTQTPMPPAPKMKINIDLERLFEQYINAKYDVTKRKRFLEELSDDAIENSDVQTNSNAEASERADDVIASIDNRDTVASKIAKRSTGSVHSDCGNARSSSVQSRPRIVVN